MEVIRDHVPCSSPPLPHSGEGWGEGAFGNVHQLFGGRLNAIIEELKETLVA